MRNEKRKASGVRILVALVALALLCAGTVSAAGEAPAKSTASVQGVQVHIDPATGKLRQPTPAEMKALSDSLRSTFSRSVASTQVTQEADGTLLATAGPEFLNIWVVSLGADGSLSQTCVEGQEAAAAALIQNPTLWEER